MSTRQSLSASVSPASGTTAAVPRVSRTIEEIRASVFGHVESAQDSLAAQGWLPARLNLNKGVVRGLLEIYCWGYWQIYSLLQRLLAQVRRGDEGADALAQQVYGQISVVRADVGHARAGRHQGRAQEQTVGDRYFHSHHAKGRPAAALPFGAECYLAFSASSFASMKRLTCARKASASTPWTMQASSSGLAAGGRAAQAVHADGHEQRSSLRGDIQNVTDDGGFFDLCSHKK